MENADLVGKRLGKYDLQEEIGRGGMGMVYRGHDPALDRWVAVKVLAPHLVWEKSFVERFMREARAAAQIKHPNIVTIYDVGQDGGWYYFVMEFLEGEPLDSLIRRRGPLSVSRTRRTAERGSTAEAAIMNRPRPASADSKSGTRYVVIGIPQASSISSALETFASVRVPSRNPGSASR